MKTYYLFDPASGVFIDVYEAHESPAELGQFIAPEDSTAVPLPSLNVNEAAVFSKELNAWSVVPDFRGMTFYDQSSGVPVEIDTIGTVPTTLSANIPAAILLLNSKNKKTAQINAACAAEIVAGFVSSSLGSAHIYTATLEDQVNLLGLIAISGGGDFTCNDAAGMKANRPHTLAQLKQVLRDGGAFKDARLDKARALKDRIAAAPNADLPDAAAVDALTW